MKKYPLTGLSPKAIKCLPEVLDKAGYAGKYELHAERNTILIATTAGMIRKFYLQAESKKLPILNSGFQKRKQTLCYRHTLRPFLM